jgi:hypothetical protein
MIRITFCEDGGTRPIQIPGSAAPRRGGHNQGPHPAIATTAMNCPHHTYEGHSRRSHLSACVVSCVHLIVPYPLRHDAPCSLPVHALASSSSVPRTACFLMVAKSVNAAP